MRGEVYGPNHECPFMKASSILAYSGGDFAVYAYGTKTKAN